MPKRIAPLYPLTGEQREASEPGELAWLSASAGTGKTQVLTARVLRLLLSGVDPASILCLTFTKAGAAEMADRLHARLAHWVRLKDTRLAAELQSLGENFGPGDLGDARKLFARVLDARGGGLRIQTIHAFCQSLLAAFPAEAAMVPGFRPLEARQQALLAREALADMLVDADARGDGQLIADLEALSRRLGEQAAEAFLLRAAGAADAMDALGAPELIEDRFRDGLGVPLGDIEEVIAQGCEDAAFDVTSLRRIMQANAEWGTAATGAPNAAKIAAWLEVDAMARGETLAELREIWCTKAGDLRKFGGKLVEIEPDYSDICAKLDESVAALLALRTKAEFAAFAAAGLRAGAAFAGAYAQAKRRVGAVDFDDLIRKARDLLAQPGTGDWVRYKLDIAIDHILIDEAQDTNAAQWRIIEYLAEEFFERDPDDPDARRTRTIFAVGDFKQAIFGFQGTDPREFRAAQTRFTAHIAERKRDLRDLSLDRSYRSTPPVLEAVDAVLATLEPDAMGADVDLRHHESAKAEGPGRVTLWQPVGPETLDAVADAEESWAADPKLAFAERLAGQIRDWLSSDPAKRLWLGAKGRALRPEDVLILLRSRGELASLIVARLHKEGVPVAGVDRLMLTDPLAVQDLLAALRFALQPDDDLSLASLLVSPLFGLTQDELYALAGNREKMSLWQALRERQSKYESVFSGVSQILALADLVTPYRLLETILSGAIDGRRKILARLGEEARDPIDELLNAALQFEADNPPSLQHFLDWFENGDAEIARDPSAPLDAVRVMTAHGAKGLQAPLVILADATRNPDHVRPGTIDYAMVEGGPAVPVPAPRKAERLDRLADAYDDAARKEREEHWRLLYVAMTRAEEQLVIAGALGQRDRDGPAQNSWYKAVDTALADLAGDWQDDQRWTRLRHFEGRDPIAATSRKTRDRRTLPEIAKPAWISEPAPLEARPPRPLAPSALGPDTVSDPPPGSDLRAAAERGIALHRLFERLPSVPAAQRRNAAERWLRDSAGLVDAKSRTEIVDAALAVIENPQFEAIFSPETLAEAPVAAVVGEMVISGTADRLLVEEDRVLVVDFKSDRRVPEVIDHAPLPHLRQMAAYAAALGTIFPDRKVEAALLYSAGPKLLMLSEALIEAHKPGLTDKEQSLSPIG